MATPEQISCFNNFRSFVAQALRDTVRGDGLAEVISLLEDHDVMDDSLCQFYSGYETILGLWDEYGEDYEAQDWYDPFENVLINLMSALNNPWNYGPGQAPNPKVSIDVTEIAVVLAERMEGTV